MRLCSWLLLVFFLAGFAPADGFRERFVALYKSGKKAEAEAVLQEWQAKQPNDPEVYIMRFNLLLHEAEQLKESTGDVHVVYEKDFKKDLKSGKLDQQLAAETARKQRARALMEQSVAALRTGIAVAPDRLDIRFGLAHTYQKWGEDVAHIKVLQEALADHAKSGKPWLWRDGQPLPRPENDFVPQTIEGYANWYWQEQEMVFPQQMQVRDEAQAKEYGKQLAELIVAYYPNSSLGYFNTGLYFVFKERWAEAAPLMKQADKLRPDDPYVLLNLINIAINRKLKQEATDCLTRLQQLPDMHEQVADFTNRIKDIP